MPSPVTYTLLTGETVVGHPIKVGRDMVTVVIAGSNNTEKRTLRTSEVQAVRRK